MNGAESVVKSWAPSGIEVPVIEGYKFLSYDDCTKNLPCYWFDYTTGCLVEAKDSEYPFYAMLYIKENEDA